jgi:phytoene dehydrogenase-like protein
VIIGGGIGGLSMGIIFATLGYPVTLIEKNRKIGGMMRSYTRNGIDCDIGIHYLGALDKGQVLRRCFDFMGVTADIPLKRMGTTGIIDRYLIRHPANGPEVFDLPEGFGAYAENLKAAFPKEIKAIDAFMALLRRSARQLNDLTFLFDDLSTDILIDQAEPLSDIFDRLGCSRGLRSIIGVPAYWIGVPAARCPLFFHNMTLASYLFSAWRLVESGTHMANVFTSRFQALGGKLITGREIRRIRVKDGQVAGVRLDDETIVPANRVVSTVHPKVLIQMLDNHTLKPSYRNRIRRLKDTPGFFCVHARVDAGHHREIPHNLFRLDMETNGAGKHSMFIQLRQTGQTRWNRLTLLGDGRSQVWSPWEDTLTGQRGEAYLQAKEQEADNMIARAAKTIGPFKSLKRLDTYTPLTIRDWVNSPGGSAYGVMKSSDQLLSTALLNRTAIKGLYLAGQSMMAPGVLGTVLGSFVTAKFILGPKRFRQVVDL